MVDAFRPGAEQFVELDEAVGSAPRQELLAQGAVGAEEGLDLAPAVCMTRRRAHDANAEHGQRGVAASGAAMPSHPLSTRSGQLE